MQIKKYSDGLIEFLPIIHTDKRGKFIKTFNFDVFKKEGIEFDFKEEFYSVSKKNVLRGMHFQLPPFAHDKIVYCIKGKVLDVVVDLRVSSNSLGKVFSFDLNSKIGNVIYIPKGFAHGFYSLEDDSVLVYKTSTVYSREHDCGILWSSIKFDWPAQSPIISERDSKFESFSNFILKRVF